MVKYQGRVLLVDDEPELLETLTYFLEPYFHVIEAATDGESALKKHQEQRFDVIVSDLRMPKMTGQELLKKIREDDDDTPFIIVTGFADLDATITALRLGAFDFFSKPFDGHEVVEKIIDAYDTSCLLKQAEEDVEALIREGKLPQEATPKQKQAAKHVSYLKRARHRFNAKDETKVSEAK